MVEACKSPSAVAALHGGAGGQWHALCSGAPGGPAELWPVGVCPGLLQLVGVFGPVAGDVISVSDQCPRSVSARHVWALYRRRWRSEDAFALTTRPLNVAYGWTGSSAAVP